MSKNQCLIPPIVPPEAVDNLHVELVVQLESLAVHLEGRLVLLPGVHVQVHVHRCTCLVVEVEGRVVLVARILHGRRGKVVPEYHPFRCTDECYTSEACTHSVVVSVLR